MSWFLLSITLLIAGYFIYGTIVEKIFGINPQRQTPAHTHADGVDYVPMSKSKIWLIQLLNIAGTGPIFGPILGALYGPVAMLWIVFGCIFAGATHDYFCGMMSIRNGGASIPAMSGKYIGKPAKHLMNVIALLLLVLVGVVFVASPASLLTNITTDITGITDKQSISNILVIWTAIIFIYYIAATLVPIDKIIGRIYPLFGALLMFMTIGMLFGLLFEGIPFYRSLDITQVSIGDFFRNFQENKTPIWPALFLTISCGALSGFHATQTPLMARCAENEREGRFVFYGAMIAEGVIALIWCMVGMSFYENNAGLLQALESTPSKVVYDAAIGMLGTFGGILAVLGVVVLPITSGDTAFRAARLLIAEFFHLEQRSMRNRLLIVIPLFIIGFIISKIDFQILWRYFSWANQMTAAIMLWTAAAYLMRTNKFHWVCTVPAVFISAVCITFILNAQMGLNLNYHLSVIGGLILTALIVAAFFRFIKPSESFIQEHQCS